MEYFGDAQGAAPPLQRISLGRGDADDCLRRIVATVTLMLDARIAGTATSRRTTSCTGQASRSRSILRRQSTRAPIPTHMSC